MRLLGKGYATERGKWGNGFGWLGEGVEGGEGRGVGRSSAFDEGDNPINRTNYCLAY